MEWCLSGTGGWRRGDYYLMGIGFQFDKMKRVVEMDGDGGCTIMWMIAEWVDG